MSPCFVTHVLIMFRSLGIPWECQNQLPVEEISNWLERSADDGGNNIQNTKERFLTINLFTPDHYFFQNVQETLDHLKTVVSFKNITE